jgi:hypothetical protein
MNDQSVRLTIHDEVILGMREFMVIYAEDDWSVF